MKIKEVKTKKPKKPVNEIKLSSFLGNYGDALAKQTFGQAKGLTKQDIMASNIFTKNFVSSALSSLDSAIKGGLVLPPRKAPAAPKAPKPKAQPTPTTPQAAVDQRLQRAAASPTSPEATAAVDARLQRAQQQTPGPTSVSDKLDRAAAQRGQVTNKKMLPRVRESAYDRLNSLFESIVNEQAKYKIKDYLKTVWFPQFMKGVDYQPNQAKIDQLLQQVERTYHTDGGRAALTQLASLSFAISPRKTQPKPPPAAQGAAPAKTQQTTVQPQQYQQPQQAPLTATWGNVKYTKGPKGWVDAKGRLADPNTVKYLDQAASQAQASTPAVAGKPKPTRKKQPSAVAKNVVPIRKTA